MRLSGLGENRAYLELVESAPVCARIPVEAEFPEEHWGISLCFDAQNNLVGVEFTDAIARVPTSLLEHGGHATFEQAEGERPNYLRLTSMPRGGVEETLTFSASATQAAWGINLDLDRQGRLVGIEFM